MEKYRGLNGRTQLAIELVNKINNNTASSVTFIQASCGQGKSYIVDYVIKELEKNKNIKIMLNRDDDIISLKYNLLDKTKRVNSLSVSGGLPAFSFGIGIGWEKPDSNYNKIRNILSDSLKKNIIICIENISEINDSLRFFITSIIENLKKLEYEFKKRIYLLITDSQDFYRDVIYKHTNSHQMILLPPYSIDDTKHYLNDTVLIHNIPTVEFNKIFDLCHGNLNLAYFLYEEFYIYNNNYLSTLQDVVAKRLSILKDQGEKHDISGRKMEHIVFSASLAIKKFSSQFLQKIVDENISDVEDSLELAQKEALLEKDFKKYYNFISPQVQKYIAEIAADKYGNILIAYYNYYTQFEQDEYYYRAYYIYKYTGKITQLSFSLFILAYSAARKMEDELKIKKIENIFYIKSNDNYYKENFEIVKNYFDVLSNTKSSTTAIQQYKEIKKYDWELPIKAELTCELFHFIYMNTAMDKPKYRSVINNCINYALNELIIGTSPLDTIIPVDETVLRLKIIYEISPCILDQLNDFNGFNRLYHKSKELSTTNKNYRQHGIGEYIENVFNRKAFLFANQAACNIYYEKAKKYFSDNGIWVEYYITLVCQAGTNIVIQEFDEAIELCNRVEDECRKKDIVLPQKEKLFNNRIIAEFLLVEQDAKTIKKAMSIAETAVKRLKKNITGEKNATQFVIYTNICSLCLYSNNEEQYKFFKKKIEQLYGCKDIANIDDESIDDFYRYYFSWFELYRMIRRQQWKKARQWINNIDGFVPSLFKKQEIFWDKKNMAVRKIIDEKIPLNSYDFCHNLVKTKRNEQVLSKFFYRGLMLSDLQYTSYF